MNMDALSTVEFGNQEALKQFLWENGVQHRVFWEYGVDKGIITPEYPLIDADIDNLDDWLLVHQIQHQALAAALNLDNPVQLLDTDWNREDDFYDWIASHLYIHEQIVSALGVQ